MKAAVTCEEMATWCVWNKSGHRPKRFHNTREEAEAEAQRLARKRPGHKFIVMQMVGKWHVAADTTPIEGTEQ